MAAAASPAAGVPIRTSAAYKANVNPKLRMLYETEEYRQVVELFSKLRAAGLLDDFFSRSVRYWEQADLRDFTSNEAEANRRLFQKLKRDWPSIWPEGMEEDRVRSFDILGKFWKRFDSSRVLDMVIEDVLPDLEKATRESGIWLDLPEYEQIDEMVYKLETANSIRQLAILAEDDQEAQILAPEVGRWVAQVMGILWKKSYEPATPTPFAVNVAFYAVILLLGVAILVFGGLVPNPFVETTPEPPNAATEYVEPWRLALQESRQAAAVSSPVAAEPVQQ